jgi:hypothetical protein
MVHDSVIEESKTLSLHGQWSILGGKLHAYISVQCPVKC